MRRHGHRVSEIRGAKNDSVSFLTSNFIITQASRTHGGLVPNCQHGDSQFAFAVLPVAKINPDMESLRSAGTLRLALAFLVVVAAIVASGFFFIRLRNRNRIVSLTGAVIQQNSDARKQSPIADVVVTATNDETPAPVKTNATGFFKLPLGRKDRRGQKVILHFRHPGYQPVDLDTTVADNIYVIHMVPLHTGEEDAPSGQPAVLVTNILIRYSTENSVDANIGTGVTTFQISNTGGIPCDQHTPCSPDGRWRAAIGSATLDAGEGNEYRNARVFCIAGPCPFTKVVGDNFTRGGRIISASLLNWSDTTTFLFQAEVYRRQVSDTVRESYPVVYGRTFNFSLPSAAEGPSLEAELDKTPITFPLGPDPRLSWASCSVIMGSRYSKSYRCELKQGFKFP